MKKLTIFVLAIVSICLFLYLFFQINDGGGKNNDIKTCLNITINVCGSDGVKGSVVNNCSSKITIAEIQTVGYDSTGVVIDQDPEYVENIKPGEHGYFESLFFEDFNNYIKYCTAEITRGY